MIDVRSIALRLKKLKQSRMRVTRGSPVSTLSTPAMAGRGFGLGYVGGHPPLKRQQRRKMMIIISRRNDPRGLAGFELATANRGAIRCAACSIARGSPGLICGPKEGDSR
jgi:hypothetical protein